MSNLGHTLSLGSDNITEETIPQAVARQDAEVVGFGRLEVVQRERCGIVRYHTECLPHLLACALHAVPKKKRDCNMLDYFFLPVTVKLPTETEPKVQRPFTKIQHILGYRG